MANEVKNVFILLISFVLLTIVHGFGTGAPAKACSTLMPGHSVDAQGTTSPYSITVSNTEYSANQSLTVTVSGTFQGILLQARKNDDSATPIGTFSSPPMYTKLTQCTVAGDSWTHASTDVKTDVSIMWNPPSGEMSDIIFQATVAQAKETFWMNVKSPVIKSANKPNDNAGSKMGISGILLMLLVAMTTILF